MEITSFPFLYQDDSVNIFSFLDDFDSPMYSSPVLNKRPRREDMDDGLNDLSFGEILGALLLVDGEEKADQELCSFESRLQKSSLDGIYRQTTQTMNEYYRLLEDQCDSSNEVERTRIKRVRRDAAEALASVASHGVVDDESNQSSVVGGAQNRRLWVKSRSKEWWEQCNSPDFPEEEFRKAFRMSRATFDMICEELASVVTKKDTILRSAIPVRQRVAACIWRLATGEPLHLVSKRFGLGVSTCHKLVLEICSAIKNVLMPKYVKWPEQTKLKEIKEQFEMTTGIPNVGGSMYTTHISIIAPKVHVAAYFNKRHTERNQKTSYSVTVQGVVDHKGVFTDVSIGCPGSMSDDKVLEYSTLPQRANEGLLKDVWVVGNSGYPLLDWVLVPYSHQNLTWTQHAFNEKIGEVQKVAKEAFMRLKGRWTCLQRRAEVKLQDLPLVLEACCVLHNICEMRNERMDPEFSFEVFNDEIIPEKPVMSVSSMQARDHIAHNLLHHNHAGTSFLQ